MGDYDWTGRVDLFFRGEWRSVCDDKWDKNEANIVCKQLGFPGMIKEMSLLPTPNGEFWLDNLECDGSEDKLCNCTSNGFGIEDCVMGEGAGVTCDST